MDLCWIGVDVSKGRLDAAPAKGKAKGFPNTPKGRAALLDWARKTAGAAAPAICMESTGPYHLPMAILAAESGVRVALENPSRVNAFGETHGRGNKTDAADARLLARFGAGVETRLWSPPPFEIARLTALDRRFGELDGMVLQEKNRLESEVFDELARESVLRHLAFMEEEKRAVERLLEEHVAAHASLRESVALLETIPGVGFRTAAGFLAETGGKAFESGEQVAAYAGLAPRRKQSGSKERPTRVGRGNGRLGSRFYMPAVSAKKHNPKIRKIYDGFLEAGMAKKAAIVACARRLLMICHAVLRDEKPFDPTRGA